MKLNNLRAHILVVDDEPLYSDAIRVELIRRGYEVDCVSRKAEAYRAIEQSKHHYAILDLHLDGESDFEKGGIELAKYIKEKWCNHTKDAFIIITSDFSIATQKFKEYGFPIIKKDKLSKLIEIFDKQIKDTDITGYNWNLDINSGNALSEGVDLILRKLKEKIGACAITGIEDVLRQFFKSAERLNLSALDGRGFSETVLFTAVEPKSDIRPRVYVFKFGASGYIDQEWIKVKQYVENSAFDCAPRLHDKIYTKGKYFGGLTFDLIREAKTLISLLIDLSFDLPTCMTCIERVFDELTYSWYMNAVVMHSDIPHEVDSRIDKFLLSIQKDYKSSEDIDEVNNLFKRDFLVKLPNLEEQRNGIVLEVGDVPRSIVHGDLHAGNILLKINSLNLAIIDFADVAENALVYEDFARLESDLISGFINISLQDYSCISTLLSLEKLYSTNRFDKIDLGSLNELENRWFSLISVIRVQLKKFLEKKIFVDPHNISVKSLKTCEQHYYYVLLANFMDMWQWKSEKSPIEKFIYRSVMSLIIDLVSNTKNLKIIRKKP